MRYVCDIANIFPVKRNARDCEVGSVCHANATSGLPKHKPAELYEKRNVDYSPNVVSQELQIMNLSFQVFEIIVSCFLVRELRQMDRVRQSGATDRKRHTQTETTIR